jgi:hypothetical protein
MASPDLRQFYGDDLQVGIVSVDDQHQSHLFRSILENLEVAVHLTSFGTPEGFLHLMGTGSFPSYTILSCHGDEGGICFGEYIEEIDVSTLVDGNMSTQHIAERGDLGETLVINTGCDLGEEKVAADFLRAGARAYIGTQPNPDWRAHSLFVQHFFYDIVRRKTDDKAAWKRAASYDEDSHSYLYYDSSGCYRVS